MRSKNAPEYPKEMNDVIAKLLALEKAQEAYWDEYYKTREVLEKEVYRMKIEWLKSNGLLGELTFGYDGSYNDRVYFTALYDDTPTDYGRTSDEVQNILNDAFGIYPHGSAVIGYDEEQKSEFVMVGDDGSIRISFKGDMPPNRVQKYIEEYNLKFTTKGLHEKVKEKENEIKRIREIIAFVEDRPEKCYYCEVVPAKRKYIGKIKEPICDKCAEKIYRKVPVLKKKSRSADGGQQPPKQE